MKESLFLSELAKDAKEWESRNLRRERKVLVLPAGPRIQLLGNLRPSLSFLSNDYLGLASHPDLKDAISSAAQSWGAGAASSPMVSGHMQCHADAEQALAAFTGFEEALLFITGYMANLAVITSVLTSPEDVVFSDHLNHASLIDACRLSRARIERYPHLDMLALAESLKTRPARRRLIVTDAVFSMDGDRAPLGRLLELAEEFDALILIDDAHGFGVLGAQGRGSVSEGQIYSDRVILMATLGKAAGLSGAFVASSAFLIEYLLQHARTYVFSTAPSPALVGAIPTSLKLIQEGEQQRSQLRMLTSRLSDAVGASRYPFRFYGTPIVPVIVGDEAETMHCARLLADQGVWVAGIRPPTVPVGSSRLRISLSAAHTFQDVDLLVHSAKSAGFFKERSSA
jgi:8-amino-7-oxononanoate synthase